ncbi:hypothetical protein [Streptomyces massasporeus]|uniref:hypothetical protein n=1 Tax=Streptomyces massasporeus TaxID=67324 RepID=UPI0034066991
MVLPRHREIVAARTLTAFAEGAEASRRSAAVHLPAPAGAEGPAGAAVRLALAHGLGAHRPAERVAADVFLTLTARQNLDEEQFGRDLAALLTGSGCLKVSRVVESLTLAARGGAHPDVAIVLAGLLGGRPGQAAHSRRRVRGAQPPPAAACRRLRRAGGRAGVGARREERTPAAGRHVTGRDAMTSVGTV